MAVALVTGGAGFIGSQIARSLLAEAHEVRVLDDLSTGSEANLEGLDVDFVVGDIGDMGIVRDAVKGVDWIFHLAAKISVPNSFKEPIQYYETNLMGSLNVLQAASSAEVEKVVMASSAAVYGESTEPLRETSPKHPISPYAETKIAMEQAARLYHDVYGLPTVSLRYFNVYGPRQSPDSPYAAVIPIFIRKMLDTSAITIDGDGKQTRDFVFVEEVAKANLLAVEQETTSGNVYNIGAGVPITILDLVSALQELLPDAPPPNFGPRREGDIRFSEAAVDSAREALGYRPVIDLVDGLRTTVEWYAEFNHQKTL